MPYCKKYLRDQVQEPLDELIKGFDAMNREDLASCITYVFFKIVRRFYEGRSWYFLWDVKKICGSVWDEFKRRFIHPYEDKKIEENGDVE